MNDFEAIEFTADSADRLDKLVAAQLPNLSRARVQAIIKEGHVTVDGETAKSGVKLRGGETVRVSIPIEEDIPTEAEDIPLNVIYEDEVLAVIDKPAGLVVHPGSGVESGTLVNALLARYPELAAMNDAEGRQGIVHRLDKDTSGLMVIARTAEARDTLMAQFQARTVDKTYLALLERAPKTRTGRVDAPIGRDPKQRKRMAVIREGKSAVTEFTIIDDEFREGQALVEVHLLTGRTHQIRVHMAFIGAPVVGDTVYGFRKQRIGLKRNFLHAARLAFDHPVIGERMTFESPLPRGLQNILDKLR
jgi:23S rRNA pseudouridine1911/1915/1917 synthase